MNRIYIKDLKNYLNQEVEIFGWVDVRRDQGKLIFIELRDNTAKVQMVALPDKPQVIEQADELRSEWVIKVRGKINPRPERNIKKDVVNGELEIEILDIEILNKAETPKFDISTDGYEIGEENRLRYRYLDLRRPRLANNLKLRHQLTHFIRNWLSEHNFLEIETPILTKSTPEGARDYVVPSRLYPQKFYALPQSPQQYKQLLMASGVDRYFQIAKCFRDEDTRGDRQPEFTQIDMEMSFVDQETIMNLNEQLLIELVKKLAPNKKIKQIPFPRITYQEAMKKYNSDRPDLREKEDDENTLAFCWVIDFPFFEKTENNKWTFTHNPFSAAKSEHQDWLMKKENVDKILTSQYDIVLNGFEIGGGSIRNHQPEALVKVFEIMDFSQQRIKDNFNHMIEALSSGCPPHGGIAWGFDRLISILTNEPNIREVIAFPKTGEGRDLMMEAPSSIEETQLKELGIKYK